MPRGFPGYVWAVQELQKDLGLENFAPLFSKILNKWKKNKDKFYIVCVCGYACVCMCVYHILENALGMIYLHQLNRFFN